MRMMGMRTMSYEDDDDEEEEDDDDDDVWREHGGWHAHLRRAEGLGRHSHS
jgi:hypothetical protein